MQIELITLVTRIPVFSMNTKGTSRPSVFVHG